MINALVTFMFYLVRSLVALLVPKDRNLWIFGAYSGLKYSDNSKYLFEYIQSQPDVKAVWLTKKDEIVSDLRSRGYEAYLFFSIKGIWYAIRARYAILCCAFDDVGPFAYINPKNLQIVQLFHGTPLKTLDSTLPSSCIVQLFRKLINIYVGRKYDYIFSTSEASSWALNQYFRVSDKLFHVTGYPRNDRIFFQEKNEFLTSLRKERGFKKVILFLPTWREYTVKHNPTFNLFSDYGFDADELTRILDEEDAIFIIKLHYKDAERASAVLSGLKDNRRIILISDRDIEDPYVLLSEVDLLVTDYSSIFFDYLMLDRPIIFTPFDLNDYKKYDRGFYFSYEENTPGPKVGSWGEFCSVLSSQMYNSSRYQSDRSVIGKKFNEFSDGYSSERILRKLRKNGV